MSVALENTKLMTWTTGEIEEISARRPRLAFALLQLLVQRSMDFGSRIESFSVDNIARRLARTLIRFSERLGHEAEDGSVQMIPFTHELLSQYVGTSREIVTHYMNQFRRQGYLTYSRKGILLHRDALKDWLRHAPGEA
jgi:CRP-like cAMP-binding protein